MGKPFIIQEGVGTTIFFATHYMEEADRYAERISLINRGKIIAEGTPLELKKTYVVDKVVLRVGGDAERAKEVLSGLGFSAVAGNNGEIWSSRRSPRRRCQRL